MPYYKRISDNDMTSEFVDGSVLLHTDMNEIETLTKTGINANYEDIQKLQDGTLTVQTAVNATNATNATTASQLSGATLSKYTDETLQDNDAKIPTSKQVKEYVDGISPTMDYAEATNKPSINGVTLIGNKTSADLNIDVDVPFYYWDGLNTATNVAMFNEICDKYTNGEKFTLVGKVALENGYTYNGTFYERTIDVVVPISVKDFTEYEDTENTGHSVFSFMTEPVRTTGGYAIGSVDLIGNAWGEFTGVNLITWAYSEGPAMSGNTINVVSSLPAADYTTVGKVYQYMGTTTSDYTNGYFYTCVEIPGSGASTYEWQQLSVQPGTGDAVHYLYAKGDHTTQQTAIDIDELTIGELYIVGGAHAGSGYSEYFKATVDGVTSYVNISISSCHDYTIPIRMRKYSEPVAGQSHYTPFFEVLTVSDNTSTGQWKYTSYQFGVNSDKTIYCTNSSGSSWTYNFALTDKAQTISGKKTFSTFPETSSNMTPTTDWQLVNKKYVDTNTTQQMTTMPTADSTNEGKIYQYTGATDANYTNGYFYKCVSDGASTPTYSWEPVSVQQGGSSSQVTTMPTADSTNVGQIVQYTGTTDSTYTNGYFYECEAQGTDPETYAWEAISVQAGGGGGLTNLSDVDNGGLQQTTCTVNNPSLRANSVALGYQTSTNGYASLAEGYQTKTLGQAAHAEGQYTIALGQAAHAEGYGSQATSQLNYIGARGYYSHSEGIRTCAAGTAAHAEGYGSPDSHLGAYGNYSHTEGSSCHASADNAHAEGSGCRATGTAAHAEGQDNQAVSANSHVEGRGNLIANLNNTETHIQGRYALQDLNGDYAHIVGNGTNSAQSNAHTIDWSGNAWFAGDVKVGGTGYADSSADTLVKKSYVDNMSMRLPYRMGYTQFSDLTLPQHSSEGSETFSFPLPSEYTGADTKVLQTYIYGASGGGYFNDTHYFTHAYISEIMGSYNIMIEVYYGANQYGVNNVTIGVTLCEF